jgi:hypothetical protein
MVAKQRAQAEIRRVLNMEVVKASGMQRDKRKTKVEQEITERTEP